MAQRRGVVWLQLPGIIFFSFAMRCLGTLSEAEWGTRKALAGYTYEHIDFTKEVIGVTARNMAYGFSQEDASDMHEAGDPVAQPVVESGGLRHVLETSAAAAAPYSQRTSGGLPSVSTTRVAAGAHEAPKPDSAAVAQMGGARSALASYAQPVKPCRDTLGRAQTLTGPERKLFTEFFLANATSVSGHSGGNLPGSVLLVDQMLCQSLCDKQLDEDG
eukprot:Skav216389  [mRNA]  locus=scaffold1241:330275:334332:+ [translate_table: standard]